MQWCSYEDAVFHLKTKRAVLELEEVTEWGSLVYVHLASTIALTMVLANTIYFQIDIPNRCRKLLYHLVVFALKNAGRLHPKFTWASVWNWVPSVKYQWNSDICSMWAHQVVCLCLFTHTQTRCGEVYLNCWMLFTSLLLCCLLFTLHIMLLVFSWSVTVGWFLGQK